MGWYYGFAPYVSVAKRRANAAREMSKLAKKGRVISPVKIDGPKIANTFWGKAWCENLESYGDYANRIPRGRTYVRNGSVVDLQIKPGRVTAVVSGSELYDITIKIKSLDSKTWCSLKGECGGQIGSLVELLQGKLSKDVMALVTRREAGLFPSPDEIDMDCSCPDGAYMCKHIAAAMYGVGARLDEKPELLFALRDVDHLELIAEAGAANLAAGSAQPTIAEGDLADVFGIELEAPAGAAVGAVAGARATADSKRASRRPRSSLPKRGQAAAKVAPPSKPKAMPSRKQVKTVVRGRLSSGKMPTEAKAKRPAKAGKSRRAKKRVVA